MKIIMLLLFLIIYIKADNLLVNYNFSNNSNTIPRGGWKQWPSVLGWTCSGQCQILDCMSIPKAPLNCTDFFLDLDSSRKYEIVTQFVNVT